MSSFKKKRNQTNVPQHTAPVVVPEPIVTPGLTADQYLREKLVGYWNHDVGQEETHGRNRSPMIDYINKITGAGNGAPYCIGGLLVRGVRQMCLDLGLKCPVPIIAGTQSFWAKSAEYRTPKGSSKLAQHGDIGILRNKGDKSHGHAFGFDKDETSKQYTVEYNTNGAGSRDGQGVYKLVRTQSGTATKDYLGSVDVVKWILAANPNFKVPTK